MRMKIVIVGDGKVGSALTIQLAKEGHDVVVIDSNRLVLEEAQQSLDVNVVHGTAPPSRYKTKPMWDRATC